VQFGSLQLPASYTRDPQVHKLHQQKPQLLARYRLEDKFCLSLAPTPIRLTLALCFLHYCSFNGHNKTNLHGEPKQ